MNRYTTIAIMMFALLAVACSGDDDDDDAGTRPLPGDDDADDDTGDDGRLYAAAGCAPITPTPENHPEPIYLGGVVPSRAATGVHDDLYACALVLTQGEEQATIVSLDVTAFTLSRAKEIRDALAAADDAIDAARVFISSTHTHEAPDLVGVYGPNLLTSGVSPTYMAFVQDTAVDLALGLWAERVPVTMSAATATIDDALSNEPTWIADLREPDVTMPTLSVARFAGGGGATVATLLNWHSHPEVMIDQTLVSADFPSWARARLVERLGGAAVYVTGAVGGLASPTGASIPALDEDGEPITEGDEPVYLTEPSWDKTRSLGYGVADRAIAALETASETPDATLSVLSEELLVPVTNPIMILAFLSGLVEYDDEDVFRDRAVCGPLGCARETLALVRVGPVAIVTSPGETFPETVIGRDETTVEYGGEWGPFTYPAKDGFAHLIDAPVPMHLGLCNDAVGYLVPESDWLPFGHPDHYEEDLVFARRIETIYRDAVVDMLAGVTW